MKTPVTLFALSALLASLSSGCNWELDDDDDGEIGAFGLGDDDDDDDQFRAALAGENERPVPVETNASGTARLTTNDDDDERFEIDYTIDVAGLDDVVAAHIHMGGPDEAGPVVATLFASEVPVDADGSLATGTVRAADLEGPMDGATIEELVDAMIRGDAYVNVHTTRWPDGEIRGQIVADENVDDD